MFEKVVRRGTLLTVIVLIVSVMGILAAFRVPVQMIPDLEVRAITVETRWPGATPQDVEKEILIEQEDYLRTIPNLQRITATASSSRAQIELEFPFGIDITETLIRVSNALTQVPSYPLNVDEPRIYATSFSSNSFMFFHIAPLPGNPRGLDMDLMRDFLVDNVRTRMSSVAGVSEINIGGGAERQIQILLDQVRMAERGLSVVQVRDAVRDRNRDISAGEVNSGKRRYLLRTVGRFADIEALGSTILARRGDSVIRLEDVATVRMDHSEITRLSWMNGEPSIMVSVRREAGSNVIAIKEALLQEVAVLNREVLEPAGMRMSLTADDVGYVQASLTNVWINLGLGAVLASGILLLFLGSVPPTAIGAMGIPICTIAAFLGLLLAGRTINVISLAGVAFAIGMTLDNSIVVLESIELARRRGLERFEAAVTGVRQVWPAVLASTSTTILVFLPVLFVVQEAGQLYSDVAIAISASILASMLVAIMVVPTASARLPFNQPNGATSVHPLRERILSVVSRLIATPVNRLATIGVTAAISIVVIAGLMPPAEYLPEGEEPKVFARVSAPPGYNLSTMLEIAEEMQESLVPRVNADMASFNRNPNTVPPLKYVNMWATAEGLTIISQPVDAGHIHLLMEALDRLFEAYPGIRSFSSRGSIITSNSGGTRSVTLDIAGPRLEVIYEVASHVYERAQQVLDGPRIQTNPRTLSLAQPLVEVRPDWERAAELGLDAGGLGFTVAALTNGAFVDEFFLDDDKIDIYLYSGAGTSASLDDLESVLVYVPTVGAIPLSSLASVVETADTSSIRRVNGRRTVTLNIIPPRDVALETGVEIVRRDVIRHLRDAGAIPADVAVTISGAADQLDATRAALSANFVVALVIVYLLLVAIFTHWGYPLLIMATIPLGIAGGFVGLWLLNAVGSVLHALGFEKISQPFDMISMLGFLILMGTVVNNPILIVHRAVDNVRGGLSAIAAVREAVEVRLRPIAMSTLTTFFGLAPLVLIPGEGTELYRGVGAIVMFGILGSAVVALTLLPALTVLVLEWRPTDWFPKLRSASISDQPRDAPGQ